MEYTSKLRRKKRIRGKISGTAARPRLSIFRSNKNIFIQAIDDVASKTLVSASTYGKTQAKLRATVEHAKIVGSSLGKKLKEQKINEAVFDRNSYRYHGVVQACADAIRAEGIKF